MIPQDSITFTDDGHAWLVITYGKPQNWPVFNDRPCDTCEGSWEAVSFPSDEQDGEIVYALRRCPHCIDGRHTFEISTYCEQQCDVLPCKFVGDCSGGVRTLRVSVVPGMVLPLTRGDECPYAPHICLDDLGRWDHWDGTRSRIITVPPAAAPGMWAVKLKVQS